MPTQFVRRLLLGVVWILSLVLGGPSAACADEGQAATRKYLREHLGIRFAGYISTFVSADQTNQLGFDRFGVLGDVNLGLTLLPWLTAELGGTGGAFWLAKDGNYATSDPDPKPNGGLVAPWLGVRVHATNRLLAPFLGVSGGPGFTGPIVRPFFQANLGVDIGVSRGVTLGPWFGCGLVVSESGSQFTSSASYFSVGITVAYRALPPNLPPRFITRHTHTVERIVVREPPPAPREPPPSQEEIDALLDRALPAGRTDRMELLAPVLFAFDSDQLEPIGVAMLHEVRSLLVERTDIELLAVLGFADRRGSDEYNMQLSTKRAERVRGWLIEHGIAPERLVVRTEGARDLVENGESEAEQQQNRRVVFRVLRLREEKP